MIIGLYELRSAYQDMSVDKNMPILIVDDYKTMLRIVRNLLKQVGFENVDEAADGGEAFNKMKEKKYGLVISDWNMEPVTGFPVCSNRSEAMGICKERLSSCLRLKVKRRM